MAAEDSLTSALRRGLDVDVPTDRADAAVAALRQLIGYFPNHPAILPITGAGVAAGRPFVVTPPFAGEPLDRALEAYGPAELGDALPRLQVLAEALDLAATRGTCHGALHPRSILVAPDETRLHGLGVVDRLRSAGIAVPPYTPYVGPEVLDSGEPSPKGDQFAFAAIAYEWLFGRPVVWADGAVDVPALPEVRDDELAHAFTRALADDPARRFGDCVTFVAAIERCRRRSQPPRPVHLPETDELPLNDDIARMDDEPEPLADANPRHWRRLGATAAVLIGGAALGVLAVSIPRHSNDSPRPAAEQGQPFTDAVVSPPAPISRDGPPSPPPEPPPVSSAPAGDVVRASSVDAGLLVHSVPAGATVTIDGVDRGRTPVAVRGLPLGTRTVVVARSGFRAAERRVLLTADRPSRTLEMQLAPVARAVPVAGPAREPSEGGLLVDSRPAGAAVSIDGRPAGVTPLLLTGIAPGSYRVSIEHPGYRVVTTSVEVKAGERARVAARLEGGR